MADLFKILLAEKLGHCDSLYESVIGKKLGGYSWQSDYETTPYLYRAMPNLSHYYNREIMDAVVGGSVGWNQLVKNALASTTLNGITITKKANGKYDISGTASENTNINFNGENMPLRAGGVYAVSGCPAGGSNGTYAFGIGGLMLDFGNGAIFKNTNNYAIGFPALVIKSGVSVNFTDVTTQLTDLTLALGSTIADYVYSLEQATAGSGVAWLKEHFPRMFGQYNPYDAGSIQSVSGLVSHDTVGFNQWDEEWESGEINAAGQNASRNDAIRSNFIRVIPNATYSFKFPATMASDNVRLFYYDKDKNFIDRGSWMPSNSSQWTNGYFTFTPSSKVGYIRFIQVQTTTYKGDICINLSDASRNGQYEPYRKSSYPLDSTLTLRGIPKLDNGKLYYDGDVYEPDGTVTRKYGVVDLGTLSWSYRESNQFFFASISGKRPYTSATNYPTLIASIYPFKGNIGIGSETTLDKAIWNRAAQGSTDTIIKDTSYVDATEFKSAMNGVYLVYELATPTTETAQPFTKTQLCDSGGTEEFVTSGIVSVGHKSKYAEK